MPRARTVAVPLLLAVVLAACSGADMSRDDAARSKAHVLDVSRHLLGRLSAVGSFARAPSTRWSGCDDLGGKVAYRVSGRLDAADGAAAGLLDAVRGRLSAGGVQLRDVSAPGDGATTVQGDLADVRVQLTGYPDRPVVVLSLVGPCLDVGEADEALLAEPPEPLTLR